METIHSVWSLILLISLQGVFGQNDVRVTPDRATLTQGSTLRVMCKSAQPLTYCRFTVPGVGGLNLGPAIPPHQGLRYYGSGLDKGECGLEVMQIAEKHNGNIMCSMGYTAAAVEGSGNMRLTVAKAPPAPVVNAQSGTHDGASFLEGETIRVSCRVENARPVANITWFIEDEPLYYGLSPAEFSDGPNDLRTISQNLTHKLRFTDNGKNLKCVATHMAQDFRSINQTLHKLNVRFPPKPPSREIERFGFTIGEPGEIVVQVYANPQPTFKWEVGHETLAEGGTDTQRRLVAQSNYKGHGMYDAKLMINRVTKEEVDKQYLLWAENSLGQARYLVAISTNPAPPPEMTAGAIAGIIIAALLIILLIFMLVFARATGRWCFAGGAIPKHSGESSDTESADHGSADKSSVSKLTESGVKKHRFGFLDLMRKNKARAGDAEDANAADAPKETLSTGVETGIPDGVVYAELDIVRGGDPSARTNNHHDPDKTEYAEIIHPTAPLSKKEELRKSRENLADLNDDVTTTPDGKKEAAV